MYDIADCRLFSVVWERNKHQYYENSNAVAAVESYTGKAMECSPIPCPLKIEFAFAPDTCCNLTSRKITPPTKS